MLNSFPNHTKNGIKTMILKVREVLTEKLTLLKDTSFTFAAVAQNIKARMKEDFNEYSDQADLAFIEAMLEDIPLDEMDNPKIGMARITFRSAVGANPASSFHGSYTVNELRTQARKHLKTMKVIPASDKKSRKKDARTVS